MVGFTRAVMTSAIGKKIHLPESVCNKTAAVMGLFSKEGKGVSSRPKNRSGAVMDRRAERLAQGDPSAFAELYDACADRVHHYLVVRLGSRADADDVLQETFVRLARTRKQLASVDNLLAYVFATARNEAIRLLERQAREGRLRADFSRQALFHQSSGEVLQDIETAEWVTSSLARLNPDLREVVELKFYAGLTLREIGEVTGLPLGTVATRYRSALEKMRGQMVEDTE
jgi:RNA polymerase sigma-70 factor (ECF subfamily)